ncbi:putative UDP-glucose:sterol glucosyltransferase [Streptantibioticus cattleyicolor NRRL 8057 = DSM 46488]|nr:putative UDP-glucose:sterol glucosyltransferase [Streptantibioticus cattleyicolor NRRL 8057 = DSM 46488]
MAAGSRGDVAPYTGIGARLREAGHEVALATHSGFAEMVKGCGLAFRDLPGDPRTPDDAADRDGGGRRTGMRGAGAFVRKLAEGVAQAAEPGADLLLLSATTEPLGAHVAEAMDIPYLGTRLQPATPTGEFAPPLGGARSLGRWGNRAAGRLALRVVDRLYEDAVRDLRRRLGLPPSTARAARLRREAAGRPVLHGFSRLLVPRPADWPDGHDVVGTWWPYVAPDHQLPARLREFLAAGEPPVFVGFGSMGGGDGERLSAIAGEALRRAGVRGVVQAGWAGLEVAGDEVITIGDVPHSLLFPHLAAVVQHCGAGTTAAALRAGVPVVPVPVTADQPFWAHRAGAVGAATAPLPAAGLTGDRLGAAIREAVTVASYRRRAEAVAEGMAAEDGAGRVVEAVARFT